MLVTLGIGMCLWATTPHPQFGPYACLAFVAALALGAVAGLSGAQYAQGRPDGSLGILSRRY